MSPACTFRWLMHKSVVLILAQNDHTRRSCMMGMLCTGMHDVLLQHGR